MRLDLKILLPALLSLVLLAGIGISVSVSLHQQQKSLLATSEKLLLSNKLISGFRQQNAAIKSNLLLYMLTGKSSSLALIADANKKMDATADEYSKLAGNDGGATLLREFRKTRADIVQTLGEMIHSRVTNDAPSTSRLTEKWALQHTQVESRLQDLEALKATLTKEALSEIAHAHDHMLHATLAGILLAILVLTAAFLYIRHNVSRRLLALVEGAKQIGYGQLTHRIGLAKTDEIGMLGEAFDNMAEHLQTGRGEIDARLQERDAAIQELEAFCYSVSHDLRAPLRAVDGFAHLTARELGENAPPKARLHLQRVRDSAQQMGMLIDDLLALSRFSRQPLTAQNVAGKPLVQECLQMLGSEYDTTQTRVAVGEIPSCHGDPQLLKQVWINLISNALKYSSKREDSRVEIGSLQQADETVYFVRDNGAGFDMRYADKLFGVFQRLHAAREFPGTGVGLAIVQRIIKRHGGRVWAEAALNQGAAFFFTVGAPRHA